MKDTSTLEIFTPIMKHWWVIVILALGGGLAGWTISLFKNPVYEAEAYLLLETDRDSRSLYNYIELSDGSGNVSNMISQRALGPDLIATYGEKCAEIKVDDLQIEKRKDLWALRVRCSDPLSSAVIANAWADEAFTILEEAYEHSVRLASLITLKDMLIGCQLDPTQEICSRIEGVESLQNELNQIWEEIGIELQASQGITPSQVFWIESYAETPMKPIRYGVGSLVLAGTMIGLTSGILFVSVDLKKVTKKWS